MGEKAGEGRLGDEAGKRCVEAGGLDTKAAEERAAGLGGGLDTLGFESGPVDLQVEAQVVNEGKRRAPVQEGAEERRAGGV